MRHKSCYLIFLVRNVSFKEHIDRCAEILQPHLAHDLREIIYPKDIDLDDAADRLKNTMYTQPALFAIEYALAKLWMSCGIAPAAMVGHSIGEYVAACLAGVFSLEDALALVAARGRLIQTLPSGSMLAVFLPEEDAQSLLNEALSLAVINGPQICVISGGHGAIDDLAGKLDAQHVSHRRLHTSHAFHSMMMEPILEEFTVEVNQVNLNSPTIPFMSNVTGTWITQEEAGDPAYWARHLRSTVRFSDCLENLFQEPGRVFLESGPGNMFSTLIQQHPKKLKTHGVFESMRHPKELTSDVAFLYKSLGKLWLAGVEVDWPSFYSTEKRRRIPLPTYPFTHLRYWVEPANHAVPRTDNVVQFADGFDSTDRAEQIAVKAVEDGSEESRMNEIEKDIARLWREILGIRKIGLYDNYFELGGSSLMAVRLFAQIEKKYSKRLPLATLYEAPTVRQFSQLIAHRGLKPSWSSLVEIQAGNSKPPVFFMHAEGGNVLEYYPLAKHLGPEQPFYGLQAIGLEGTEIVAPTIEEMATHFINEIKNVQPTGPYLIGGYCLGGLVAFEMAHQLQACGEEVALLMLISTSTPDHLRKTLPNITIPLKIYYRIHERLRLELKNISTYSLREKIIYVRERFFRFYFIYKVRLEEFVNLIFAKFKIQFKWHSRAYILQKSADLSDASYMAYKPKPLNNKLILLRVSERTKLLTNDPYLGWAGLADKDILTLDVNGFHKNILKEPNVEALAEKVKYYLEKTQADHKKTLSN